MPEAAALSSSSQERGRADGQGALSDDIPGALRWLQRPEGVGVGDVGIGARSRCSSTWGFVHNKRVSCLAGFGTGAKCIRCGKLGFGVHPDARRGPTYKLVSREDEYYYGVGAPLLSSGSSSSGYDFIGLFEGDRPFAEPEARDPTKEEPAPEAGGYRSVGQSEATAKVPEEAKGHRRWSGLKHHDEQEFRPPLNAVWSEVHASCGRDQPGCRPTLSEEEDRPTWPPRSPMPKVDLQPEAGSSPSAFLSTRQASYPLWLSKLTSLVLRSRNSFSAFLSLSIHVSKRSCPRAKRTPALFPVPVPVAGIFSRMPTGASSSKRRSLHLNRALHVICVALNCWYFGGEFWEADLLWREPSPLHFQLFARIRSYIKADGLVKNFDVLHAGRKIRIYTHDFRRSQLC